MVIHETIKCPHCGADTFIEANKPIYLTGDIKCPHCGYIIIKTLETTYSTEDLRKLNE